MTPTQMSLIADAQQAAVEAVAAVEAAANRQWMAFARGVIRGVAMTHETFTTDDVWEVLDIEDSVRTHEPRALGAVMRQASHDGLIMPTDRYTPSRRVECHGRPVRVWKGGE